MFFSRLGAAVFLKFLLKYFQTYDKIFYSKITAQRIEI